MSTVTPIPVNLITHGTLDALGEALQTSGAGKHLLGDPAVIYDRILELDVAPILRSTNVALRGSNRERWYNWSVPLPMMAQTMVGAAGLPIFGIEADYSVPEDVHFAQYYLSHEVPGFSYLQIRRRCAVLCLLDTLNLLPECPQQ